MSFISGLVLAHWLVGSRPGPYGVWGWVLVWLGDQLESRWMGPCPCTNKLVGGIQNDTTTSVLMVGSATKSGCCQHLCPQGECSIASCLSWRVSKMDKWLSLRFLSYHCFYPGSKKHVRYLCVPFKRGVSFLKVSTSGLQNQTFRRDGGFAHHPDTGPINWCSLLTSRCWILTIPCFLPVSLWFLFL